MAVFRESFAISMFLEWTSSVLRRDAKAVNWVPEIRSSDSRRVMCLALIRIFSIKSSSPTSVDESVFPLASGVANHLGG